MAFKMYGKSPMMKALIGKQKNLPEELKAKILAAPDNSPKKKHGKSPKKKYKSDAQRKAVHASKAEKAAATKNYMNPEEYKVFNMGNTPKKMYGKKKK